MNDDFERMEKALLDKRQELKGRFLREEISAEEYIHLKEEIEIELGKLEKNKEQKEAIEEEIVELKEEIKEAEKEEKSYQHKVISKDQAMDTWKYVAAILGIILVISLSINFGLFKLPFSKNAEQSGDKSAVASNFVDYLNSNLLGNEAKASLKGVEEKNDVYLLKLEVNGQVFDSYITKDGQLFFPSAIDTTGQALNNNPPAPTAAAPETAISADDDAFLGAANAPVTIVEFSDYQCPFCARAEPAVKQVLETYGDQVKFVYRDFPLSIHQYAQKAAEASECAGEQGKFWEYHDLLFEKQDEWSSGGAAKFKEYAAQLGLNAEQFNACLDNGKYTAEVQKDFEDGQKAGVSGTPAFFINGRELSGAQPFSAFKQLIDAELK